MKLKKSFFTKNNEEKKYDVATVVNMMTFFAVLALFVITLCWYIHDITMAQDKSNMIVPLIQRILAIIFVFVPYLIKLIFKIKFPKFVTTIYYLFLFLSLYLGSFESYNILYPLYNRIVHGASGLVIGFCAMFFVREYNKTRTQKLHPMLVFLSVLTFALALGAVWEIYEYTFDGILNLNMQQARELVGRDAIYDTVFDLISDCVGGIVSATICAVCSYKYSGFIEYFKIEKINKTETTLEIEE